MEVKSQFLTSRTVSPVIWLFVCTKIWNIFTCNLLKLKTLIFVKTYTSKVKDSSRKTQNHSDLQTLKWKKLLAHLPLP